MTDEQRPESGDQERVSRLSSITRTTSTDESGDSVVRDYEERFRPEPKEKAKRDRPRSYSTLRVSEEERLWAAIAHGSVWLTLISGALTGGFVIPVSIFVPLVIYFMFRQRSDYVAFHALQAFVLQILGTVGALALLLVGGVVWVIGLVIAVLAIAILIGIVLVPVWALVGVALVIVVCLMPLAMLLFGTIAAVETYKSRDYRYPIIARWVDRQLAGGFLNSI